jgi:hypothetical protein
MAQQGRIDRRQILKGAGAISVGALAALAPATVLADNGDNADGLLGTWNAPHTHRDGAVRWNNDRRQYHVHSGRSADRGRH